MEKQENSGPWEISIQINLGESELEYRGKIEDLPKAISALASLPPRVPTAIGESGGADLPYSTSTIAECIYANSGAELVMAAAAKIAIADEKKLFHRNDILREMRNAVAHFKPTYRGNLSSYLGTLVKNGSLLPAGENCYTVPSKTIKDMLEIVELRSRRIRQLR